jgi:integrase
MPSAKLTDPFVKNAKPAEKGKRSEWWDSSLPAFGLRVTESGSKSWQVMYRHQGRLRRMGLGGYPVLSLADARKAAQAALRAASEGKDPAATKAEGTDAGTVKARFEEWMKRDQATNRTADEVRRTFERDVLPKWSARQASAITKGDVLELVESVVDRGAPVAANRVLAYLKRFFGWQVGRGNLDVDPTWKAERPTAEKSRDRVLSDAELVEIWRAAEKEGEPFGHAVRLLLLNGARREEVLQATKTEYHDSALHLGDDRTKTSVGREIPLSDFALEILADLPEHKGPYLFSTTKGEAPFSGVSKAMERLRLRILEARAEAALAAGEDAAKVEPMPEWRLHDLRRSMATGLQRLGVRLEVTETLLGHISGSRSGVVGVYQRHRFRDEARAAAQLWADHVRDILAQ